MRDTPKKPRIARSDLVVELEADRANDRHKFAEAFLSEWFQFPREHRPEKWAAGEAGSKWVEGTNLNEIVSRWQEAPLRFSRAARQSVLMHRYELERRDIQPCRRQVSAWFAKSGGAQVARDFWMLAVKHFEPAFAILTTREEYHRKHCRYGGAAGCQGIGTTECFHGHRVCERIPGIYWMTYLGPSLVERVGELQLKSIPIGEAQAFDKGYVLTAYESPRLIGSDDAQARERAIIRHLGEQQFFRRIGKSARRARYGSRTQRYADENRRKPTEAEACLGRILNELDGGKLRGQFICQWAFRGKWILDVYFPELRLGFEVDGEYHNQPDRKEKDRLKAQDCASLGIMLIRFTNDEITQLDRDTLAAKIRRATEEATVRRHRSIRD